MNKAERDHVVWLLEESAKLHRTRGDTAIAGVLEKYALKLREEFANAGPSLRDLAAIEIMGQMVGANSNPPQYVDPAVAVSVADSLVRQLNKG